MATSSILKEMTTTLQRMREANEMIDVILQFDEVEIPCHKVILASNCEYFRRMFQIEMREKRTDKIKIKQIGAKTGSLIVDYLYTGEIKISPENAQDLLAAGDLLLLDSLKETIGVFLIEEKLLDATNCVAFLQLSHLYYLGDLIDHSRRFISENWDEILEVDKIPEMDFLEIIQSLSPEEKFCSLQRWAHSTTGGADRFVELMENIPLTDCRMHFICQTVMGEPLLQNPEGMKIIQTAVASLLPSTNESRPELTSR